MRPAFKVYFSMFRIRFNHNMQYRAVVLGAILKGFLWALLEVLGYLAVYRTYPEALPMALSHTVSYVWARQSLIVLFIVVFGDGEIYSAIQTGEVVYDLARPVGLYGRWFCQSASNRISFALVNCIPVLALGAILPKPYGLSLPSSPEQVCLFFFSALLAFGVTVAIAMLMYVSLFYFISHRGIRIIVTAVTSFFSGGIIPLPFFPETLRRWASFLPFGSMQNMPLQIFCGNINGRDAAKGIILQVFWLFALVLAGRAAMGAASKKVVSFGG